MNGHEDVLRKVQALLDKADSTTFEAERDALLLKAHEWMTKHAIDSYELEMRKKEVRQREVPIQSKFVICQTDSPVKQQWLQLFAAVSGHARCESVVSGVRNKIGPVNGIVVGFPADVKYAEMLYTSLRTQLLRQVEPRPDPDKSYGQNVVMLMESGQSRKRIADLLGVPWSHAEGMKMSKMWRVFKESQGQEAAKGSRPLPTTYMRNFANGFVAGISMRFWNMKMSDNRGEVGTKAIVLAERSADVQEALRKFFPRLGKPMSVKKGGKFDWDTSEKGRTAAEQADLGIRHAGVRSEQEGSIAGQRSALPK